MLSLEMIHTYIEYHYAMTRRVWDSLAQISEEQFLADEAYSRGSIRNLMVHLANSDRRWLAGLKNQPEVGNVKFEDYPNREAARAFFEQIAKEVSEYVAALTEAELGENPNGMPGPRWQALLHMVNHGTDHRATVLERLHALGAPTFDQDFILWLWGKK
jgi:uncharacterized damage-inducible protein DinB